MATDHHLFTNHQIKIMKVALAIAIIRQKPADCQDVADFTRKLSLEFSEQQKDWKKQAEKFHCQLLELKQKQHMEQIHNLHNGTQDILLTDDNIFTSEVCSNNSKEIIPTEEIASHIKFIKYLSKLHKGTYLTQCDDACNTLSDTIMRSSEILSDVIMSNKLKEIPVNENVLTDILQSVLDLSKLDSMKLYEQDILQAIMKILKASLHRLFQHLLTDEDISTLKSLVHLLSSLEPLYNVSLISSAAHIEKCIKELKEKSKDPANLEPVTINSLGIALVLSERLVTNYRYPIPFEAMESIGTSVHCMMICTCYPLVSFTVWKLHGLMKSKKNNDNGIKL